MLSYGTINVLERGGRQVFEAIYQPSYRHNARRLDFSPDCVGWPTEASAIAALERQAERDGTSCAIQAGKYPRGTRTHGQVIAR